MKPRRIQLLFMLTDWLGQFIIILMFTKLKGGNLKTEYSATFLFYIHYIHIWCIFDKLLHTKNPKKEKIFWLLPVLSLLSLTSLLSAPEREVTSPSDFKVVGALNTYQCFQRKTEIEWTFGPVKEYELLVQASSLQDIHILHRGTQIPTGHLVQ
jgi:hypothetical protein